MTMVQADSGWILFKSAPELILAFQTKKNANIGLLQIIMDKMIKELKLFFE